MANLTLIFNILLFYLTSYERKKLQKTQYFCNPMVKSNTNNRYVLNIKAKKWQY